MKEELVLHYEGSEYITYPSPVEAAKAYSKALQDGIDSENISVYLPLLGMNEEEKDELKKKFFHEVSKLTCHQTFDLSLTGGKRAKISVPANLTKKDLEILKNQVEVLHLQASSESLDKKQLKVKRTRKTKMSRTF
ncbi:hypothetical protein BXO87_01920 [Bacillus sp. GZB]|uniref:hypothetical protein n=1 Tax=Bacillus sp. GZB TaxID=936599 RepID=UPI0009788AFD|nr:hypothetical protein [Bacillus sp. GZB]OMQ06787.1 hypothetical protein BXO87_01920 [Bacillus sp. GZB]